ncbi:MAG: peptidase M14 [Ignavibacteria bacterium]|nr:MAG: peptidase M14 [Ignavibacteria bacterium]
MAQDIQFAWSLYHGYENYKDKHLSNRRFKYSTILPLIHHLKNKNMFTVKKAGESAEGRDVYLISIGSGDKKIFCWSQMHGDEPTATASLFDIFNFFLTENHYTEFKQFLLDKTTIYFMPMVNPDGAELFQRRNILEIDLNRDAVQKQSPEAKILYSAFDEIKPHFGFNLHDQERAYAAGLNGKSAAISFLAPPFDYAKTKNEIRTNSMKLISEQYNLLSEFIPGHIAKYQDDYEPRAFGDTFAKSGSSIVLIESGGWSDDREKEYLRKINFISLLTSFKSIAEGSYLTEKIETYESIPNNEKLMMDFIIRNITASKFQTKYVIDIGINYEEENINKNLNFFFKAKIEDIGDLSVYSGYKELDATGLTLVLGKTYETVFNSINEIKCVEPLSLLQKGITNLKLSDKDTEDKYSPVLFNIILNNEERKEELKEEAVPNFILCDGRKFKYAVINGFLIKASSVGRKVGNALIFK